MSNRKPPRAAVSPMGRNSLCPCGSGRKYKRCCGSSKSIDALPLTIGSSTASALELAYQEARAGRLKEAEIVCAQILGDDPHNASVLRLSAELALGLNNVEGALERARKAIELAPEDATCRRILGEVYMLLRRPDDAIAELDAAWRLVPGDPSIGHRLIAVLMREGQLDEAVKYFRDLLSRNPGVNACFPHLAPSLPESANDGETSERAIDPRLLLACNAFGYALNSLGNIAPSAQACRRRQILDPTCASIYMALFEELIRHRRFSDALLCVRALAAVDPENYMANHSIASLSGVPLERASPKYCEQLFDRVASRFEAHLINQCQYAVPRQLTELARSLAHPRSIDGWDILDLGCGTGLVGVAFAAVAKALVGVDLSGAMLEQAKSKQVYTQLHKADIVEFLDRELSGQYDLIIAADSFIYLGRLDSILDGIRRSLCRHGFALFSVEALETAECSSAGPTTEYALTVHGRFAHSRGYIEALAGRCGLTVEKAVDTVLRTENSEPVLGRLFALRRD